MFAPMFRKIALVVGACVMALLLTACGDPSTDGAAKLATQLTEEVYKGNVQPLLDHLDYSSFASDAEAKAAQEMVKGKLTEALNLQLKITQASGGVKSYEVVKSTEENGLYNVVVTVTFGDGSTNNSVYKFRWDENKNTYLLVN